MIGREKRALLLAGVACAYSVSLLASELGFRPWEWRPAAAASANAEDTRANILTKSAQLCSRLAPQIGTVSATAQQVTMHAHARQAVDAWMVDCFDATGHHFAHIAWNGNTGEVIDVEQTRTYPPPTGEPTVPNGSAARAIARDLLVKLQPAQVATPWRLAGEPERTAGDAVTWNVPWRSGNRQAYLTIDAQTGGLVRCVVTLPPGIQPVPAD